MDNPTWEVPHAVLVPHWFPALSLERYWTSGQHYRDGGTQPWVQAFLYQLIRVCGFRRVLEFGTWYGSTSAWLCLALSHNGGGQFLGTERDRGVADRAAETLVALPIPDVDWIVRHQDTLTALTDLPFTPEFVFVDDDKTQLGEKFQRLPAGTLVAVHDAETIEGGLTAWSPIILPAPVLHAFGHLALIQL